MLGVALDALSAQCAQVGLGGLLQRPAWTSHIALVVMLLYLGFLTSYWKTAWDVVMGPDPCLNCHGYLFMLLREQAHILFMLV